MKKIVWKMTLAALLTGFSAAALAQDGANGLVRNEEDCLVVPPRIAAEVAMDNLADQKKHGKASMSPEKRLAMETPTDISWPNAGLGKVGSSMPGPGIVPPGG